MKRHESSQDPRVREILAAHARTHNGVPVRCSPTAYEKAMRGRYNNPIDTQNKIIYDTKEAAEAAAKAFAALDGDQPMEAYRCRRSRRGHCHLKTPYRR